MADLDDYGIDRPTLERMYAEWKAGASKSALERRYLGRDGSHGKLFTSLVRRFLDRETEERHPLAVENERLRALLHRHGIDPDPPYPEPGRAVEDRDPGGPRP
jgi:hypothetical protein